MVHLLNTSPFYYQEVVNGNKSFEVRINDRSFNSGDIVVLYEFDPVNNCCSNRCLSACIGCIYNLPIMNLLPENVVVFTLVNINVIN